MAEPMPLPGPTDIFEAIVGELPPTEILVAGFLVIAVVLTIVRYIVFGTLTRAATAVAVRKGYAFPIATIKDHRVGLLERLGNVLSISRTGSILTLGTSRSGKTEAAKHIVDQMRAGEDEPMLIYDHKDDYQLYLEKEGIPFDKLSTRDSDVTWNIFREIKDDRDADEIARAIFADFGEDTYFDRGARQVFAATLKYLKRNGERHGEEPSNKNLVHFFQRHDREEVHKRLCTEDDLVGVASHLNSNSEHSQAPDNVYSSIQERVTDAFVGDIAKPGDFSIREYMENPGGRALVLDYPPRQGESTIPLFRLLIDLAAREALDDKDQASYFILDEVAQIPALSRLDELVNTGAGKNVQVLVSLQSVAQLYENYGDNAADALLSGFLSTIILRCGDKPSIDFARERIGTQFVSRTTSVEKARLSNNRQKTIRRETKPSEEHPFARGEITEWDPGEGVVVRQDSWAYGRIKLLNQRRSKLRPRSRPWSWVRSRVGSRSR